MNKQEVFDEFIRMAKQERQHKFLKFNEKTSCLKHLVVALRSDIKSSNLNKVRFEQIRRDLQLKSPKDSQKYQSALNYVAINWPNWNRRHRGVQLIAQSGSINQLRRTPRTPPRVPPKSYKTEIGIRPIGWEPEEYNSNQHFVTTDVGSHEILPPLNKSQIMRVNESLQRAKYAVELARDTLIKIKLLNWNSFLNQNQQTYTDYFGSYDSTRFGKVLDNYKVLVLAFQKGPKVIDLRNTVYGKDCYAACYRRNRKSISHGSLSLQGKVDMFLGRHFFKGRGGYKSSTDSTVGTLIHEFAHGAINAVDAPPVTNPDGNALNWTSHAYETNLNSDKYGASVNNSIQASTDAADKALAKIVPNIAILNADNYGQFAGTLLLQEKK